MSACTRARVHSYLDLSTCAPKCVLPSVLKDVSGTPGLERNGPEREWAGGDRGGAGVYKEEGQNEVRRGGTQAGCG